MQTLIFIVMLLLLMTGTPRLRYALPQDGSYMAPDRTRMINGIFMVLMLLRHTTIFGVPAQPEDALYCRYIDAPLLQCIVCIYFFFSGYGIMYSMQRKGHAYLNSLLTKRFKTLYIRYIAAAAIACFLYACMKGAWCENGIKYLKTLCLLKGWWFIRMSLFLYVLSWCAFTCCGFNPAKRCRTYAAIALLGVTVAVLVSAMQPYYESWSLDTEWCFPAGMLYCMLRERAERWVNATRLPCMLLGAVVTLSALWGVNHFDVFCRAFGRLTGEAMPYSAVVHLHYTSALACIFSVGITWFFAGITWKQVPRPLVWLGQNAFYLFLFQYAVIFFFKRIGLNAFCPALGILCSVLFAVALSAVMKYLFTRAEEWWTARREQKTHAAL